MRDGRAGAPPPPHLPPLAAERRRLEGNELFMGGDAEGAAGKYHMALSYLDEDLMMQLEGAHLDQALPLSTPYSVIITDSKPIGMMNRTLIPFNNN